MQRRIEEGGSEYYEEFFYEIPCPDCQGKRLKKESLCITVGSKNISQVCDLSINDCIDFFKNLNLTEKEKFIAKEIIKEIKTINCFFIFSDLLGVKYYLL